MDINVKAYIFVSMKKTNRSKYEFGTRKVGDEILVKPLDVHSFNVALASFNTRHGRDIQVENLGEVKGEIKFTVINI